MDIVIQKLEVYRISTALNSSARIWSVRNGQQDVLEAELSQNEDHILGPYINITRFRIDKVRDVNIEKVYDNFSAPKKLVDYVGTTTVNVSSGEDVTILPGDVINQRIAYKDADGNASLDNITFTASGCTIEGESSYVMKRSYQEIQLVWDGVSNWRLG